jgi:hypothetical protein
MYFIAFFLLTAEGAEDTEEEKRGEDGCWQIFGRVGFCCLNPTYYLNAFISLWLE